MKCADAHEDTTSISLHLVQRMHKNYKSNVDLIFSAFRVILICGWMGKLKRQISGTFILGRIYPLIRQAWNVNLSHIL